MFKICYNIINSFIFCFRKACVGYEYYNLYGSCSAVETETISEHKQVLKLVMDYLSYSGVSKLALQKWFKNPIIQKKFGNVKNMKHQH